MQKNTKLVEWVWPLSLTKNSDMALQLIRKLPQTVKCFYYKVAILFASICIINYPLFAEPPVHCQALPEIEQSPDIKQPKVNAGNASSENIEFYADKITASQQSDYQLDGEVSAYYTDKTIKSEHMHYNFAEDRGQAKGNIIYLESDLNITGESADLNLKSRHGVISDATYIIPERYAHGSAGEAELENDNSLRLKNASYSTCEIDHESWKLSAREIYINQSKQQGSAKHVFFSVKKIPIFYFPYLTFPIGDQRKTGFLPPKFDDGLIIPYYLNLAPNQDATVALHYIEDHGLQQQTEYRFLTKHWRGNLLFDYLHSDEETNQKRYFSQASTKGQYKHWLTTIDYRAVSDADYFSSIGSRVNNSNITHLERKAEWSYINRRLNVNTKIQNFQTVDTTIAPINRPYRLLPQIRLSYYKPIFQYTQFRLTSQWDNFDKNIDAATDAQRFHLQPQLTARLQKSFGYISPSVTLYHTSYHYQRYSLTSDERTLPSFNLDSAIIFERDAKFFSTEYLQTLEPRLYYLKTPFKNQSAIPLFDSTEVDFNAIQLFQPNRFSGYDRIGDTHQVSVGLTKRFIKKSDGIEAWRFDVGQIFYLEDRKVTIPNSSIDLTESTSDIVFAAKSRLGNLQFNANLLYEPEENNFSRSLYRMYYQRNKDDFLSLSYRNENLNEQMDITLLWSFYRKWQFAGRWQYSITDDEPIEWIAGLQYQSCCYNLRIAKRRYINNSLGDVKISPLFELELKGLVSVGTNIADILRRDSNGFR